jgi:predicted negative regulator of RcsB-dependent stress response
MYDLEEQEKIDALKGWWHENRIMVVAVVVSGLLAFGGVTAWKAWKASQADQAAGRYASFQTAAASGDPAKVQAAARAIEEAAAGSPYAARAALAAAQALAAAGKTAEARIEYEWVIAHAAEAQLQSIARVRLAGVLADAQKYPEALATLESGIDPAFATLAGDRKGDILLAQGKLAEARAAYRSALESAERSNPLRQVLQTKVDALGADR